MESQFIEKKDTQYAYTCIHEFFSGFGLCGAIDYMESTLHAALTEKIWNKASPYEAIYFIDNMQLLCTAAFIIFNNRSQKKLAVVDPFNTDGAEMPEMKSLTHKFVIKDLWIYFPRNLTLKQYYNPYKAIKRFCNYRKEAQWKKVLEDCSEYALGRHTIQEAFPPYDMLAISLHLLQLIEACYLIDVRINREKIDADPDEKPGANNIITV